MMGYWKNPEATEKVLSDAGWLSTGDQASIDQGFLKIIGRIKDILVLANGEKVPPADMESTIVEDPLFDHALILGEQRPFLTALVVLNEEVWRNRAKELDIQPSALDTQPVQQYLLDRLSEVLHEFPGYARIMQVTPTLDPWSVENGLLTPTLKVKRPRVVDSFKTDIDRMYEGHENFKGGS